MEAPSAPIRLYDHAEIALDGPSGGNPFTDVRFAAVFRHGAREVPARGFYDGGGVYRVRFMPDQTGEWSYETRSSAPGLDGARGTLTVVAPDHGVHGPVAVRPPYAFIHADGTPLIPVGTTAYAWAHQAPKLQERTMETLRGAPFNKIRMCVFPKNYAYNRNEPPLHAYERRGDRFDHTRFNPAFFAAFEHRVAQLRDLGIEADVIIFHPYDRWGYASMSAAEDDLYLEYLVARLSAFRNVWWSLANEWDLMKEKTSADWDRFFRVIQSADPYQHPRSIHNCRAFYDHNRAWVTHLSVQSSEVERVDEWRSQYRKPVLVDECCYEGNIELNWGNITAEELVRRMWETTVRGGYPTGHAETYLDPEDVLWWAKGGVLKGQSPPRLGFLRSVLDGAPLSEATPERLGGLHPVLCAPGSWYLWYGGVRQPAIIDLVLPEEGEYAVDVLDTWNMTIDRLPGVSRGKTRIELPGRPWMAVRAVQA